MKGYDIELVKIISENVTIPVIASGGAGNYEHMSRAILEGGASAVLQLDEHVSLYRTNPYGSKSFFAI